MWCIMCKICGEARCDGIRHTYYVVFIAYCYILCMIYGEMLLLYYVYNVWF